MPHSSKTKVVATKLKKGLGPVKSFVAPTRVAEDEESGQEEKKAGLTAVKKFKLNKNLA